MELTPCVCMRVWMYDREMIFFLIYIYTNLSKNRNLGLPVLCHLIDN